MKTKVKSKPRIVRLSRLSAAFSLVEVTIAVAIAALGLAVSTWRRRT